MRLLIVQERGHHEMDAAYREALSFQKAFRAIGSEATVWGPGYPNFRVPFAEVESGCDAILVLQNYNFTWLPALATSRKLKIFWSIDSHCALGSHVNFCAKHKIQVLLNSTERYLPYFRNVAERSHWFPNCFPDDLVRPLPAVPKQYDLGFVGNHLNRKWWLDELAAKFGMKVVAFKSPEGPNYDAIGDNMVRWINSFKIHFNRNIADDINYRTFETLGCKTLLLTNATPGLERLFEVGRHLVTYGDFADLGDRINYLLRNWAAAQEIAEAGYQHVKKHHTFRNRAEQLRTIIAEVS